MTGAVLAGTTDGSVSTGAVLLGTTTNAGSNVGGTGAVLTGTTTDPDSFEIDYQVGPSLTPEQLRDYVLSYANVDNNGDGARDDAVIMSENSSLQISVTDNDSVTFTELVINQPAQFGTAVVNSNNQITYAPQADFTGLDVVSYTLKRNGVSVATADVYIGVFDFSGGGISNGGGDTGNTGSNNTGGNTGGTTTGGTTTGGVTTGGSFNTGPSIDYGILEELVGCDADVGDIRLTLNALVRQHNQIQRIQSGSVVTRENPPAPNEEAAKRVNKNG